LWEINSTRGKGWYITMKMRKIYNGKLDLGSKFTIVSLVCLIVTSYTSLYLDNCWGLLLSLLERLNTHDNFCDKNIKHIVYNVQDYSAVFIIVLFPGCVRVGILLLFGRHLHDRIISLSQESERSYSSVLRVLMLPILRFLYLTLELIRYKIDIP
jgi:hypothetical protein